MKKEKSFTIGRGRQCDVVFADDSVSRQHAQINFLKDGTILLVDCHSTHGTWLVDNHGRAQKVSQESVTPMDKVKFGHCELSVKEIIESLQLRFPDFSVPSGKSGGGSTPTPPSFEENSKLIRCECGAVKAQSEQCGVCGKW